MGWFQRFRPTVCAAAVWILVLAISAEVEAQASPTSCRGVDPVAASSSIEAGDAAIARATSLASRGRAAAARRAFEEALASYETACAAGAELALERRAIPLARLGRPLDAIVSLDAFLAAHPLESLPADDRARIESNHRSLERQVATLSITARPEATVWLAGRELGRTPILQHRLEAGGSIQLTLRAAGHQDWVQEVPLEPGITQRLAVELSPLPSQASASTQPSTESTLASETSSSQPSSVASEAEHPRPSSGGSDRVPWIAVASVAAAIGLGVGIGGVVLLSDRRGSMDGSCFGPVRSAIPGCLEIRAEYDLGVGLAIGGFVFAALAGASAIVLALLPGEERGASASIECSLGLGVACRGTF